MADKNNSWFLDPETGDYVLEDGAPVIDKGLKTPAFIRLRAKRQTWLYAPDTRWGSDYHLLKKNHSTTDTTQTVSVGNRALQPLLDDGRASEIDITIDRQSRPASRLKIGITDAQGEGEEIVLVPIKVEGQ